MTKQRKAKHKAARERRRLAAKVVQDRDAEALQALMRAHTDSLAIARSQAALHQKELDAVLEVQAKALDSTIEIGHINVLGEMAKLFGFKGNDWLKLRGFLGNVS